MRKANNKTIIGWEEWCALPELGLPAIKVKVDTGAKTSALHAYDIEPFTEDQADYVRFKIHPLQRNNKLERCCVAPLADWRFVTSSNGEREKRYVIKTAIEFSCRTIQAELTLTSRHNMAFRMLLGREALRKAKFTVDPAKSYLLGKKTNAAKLYEHFLI
jgi:ribosomal protein S6--L-glutamate ligase